MLTKEEVGFQEGAFLASLTIKEKEPVLALTVTNCAQSTFPIAEQDILVIREPSTQLQ